MRHPAYLPVSMLITHYECGHLVKLHKIFWKRDKQSVFLLRSLILLWLCIYLKVFPSVLEGIAYWDKWKKVQKLRSAWSVTETTFLLTEPPAVPPGYMTFRDIGEQSEGICFRDVTSPINELDGQSNSSRGVKHTITWVLWHLLK